MLKYECDFCDKEMEAPLSFIFPAIKDWDDSHVYVKLIDDHGEVHLCRKCLVKILNQKVNKERD